jgi:hypothetical protein
MSDAELLKYDTRARERLLRSGAITAEQVRAYVESLPDKADRCDQVSVDQPALHRGESERPAGLVPARTMEAGARMTTEGSDPSRATPEAAPAVVASETTTFSAAQGAPPGVVPEQREPEARASTAAREPDPDEPALAEPEPPINPEEPS